jgi:hypothetical protein
MSEVPKDNGVMQVKDNTKNSIENKIFQDKMKGIKENSPMYAPRPEYQPYTPGVTDSRSLGEKVKEGVENILPKPEFTG